MNEKYIATVYEKIDINENIIIFKRVGILNDVYIDFEDELNEITVMDEEEKRVVLQPMENDYVMISEDRYCYGYPISLDSLKKLYPEIKKSDDLLEKYYDEISAVINIGYYDEETDTVKIVFTNEEQIKKQEPDEILNKFSIVYETEDEPSYKLLEKDVQKMINLAKRDQLTELKDNILKFDNYLEGVHENLDFFTNKKEETKPQKNIEDILKELDNLVGLENIKEEVNKLVKNLLFRKKADKYLKLESPNLHMFFTGNPGTGKTTVARIMGDLLYSMGYTKTNSFAEITPKELIAGYVGQTATKTSEFINKNRGGVIFIDEAYVFASDAQEYAQEAIVEILKELEKKETIFIFAGYKDEMNNFMKLNPGLTSRVGYYLDYKDYSTEQLYNMFENKVKKIGFKINDNLKEKVIANLENMKSEKHFGNGRYIDKMIDKIILEHAINTEKYKRKDKLITLTDADFNENVEQTLNHVKVKKNTIGF